MAALPSANYLDDEQLVGDVQSLCDYFAILSHLFPSFGQTPNVQKTVLLLQQQASTEDTGAQLALVQSKFRGKVIHPGLDAEEYGVTVLGTPVGSDEYILKVLAEKLQTLKELGAKLTRVESVQNQ